MLLVIRCLILVVLLALLFIFSMVFCVVRPKHRDNVHVIAQIFSKVCPILGIKLVLRLPKEHYEGPNVYVANHQNNYDIFTHTAAVPKGTVSLGKKSLAWMPLFGQIYWLSGNILINRSNRHRAVGTMAAVAEKMKKSRLSVWIFPEGTRSKGRGLLPLKSGAFHTAIAASAPVIPVVSSSQTHINLNRWDNGTVIIEMLEPIETQSLIKSDARGLASDVFDIMKLKLDELNAEVISRNEQE